MDAPVLVCACEPGYVCSRCEGTPLDDSYPDERDPDTYYCSCGAHVASLPCYFPPIIFDRA